MATKNTFSSLIGRLFSLYYVHQFDIIDNNKAIYLPRALVGTNQTRRNYFVYDVSVCQRQRRSLAILSLSRQSVSQSVSPSVSQVSCRPHKRESGYKRCAAILTPSERACMYMHTSIDISSVGRHCDPSDLFFIGYYKNLHCIYHLQAHIR